MSCESFIEFYERSELLSDAAAAGNLDAVSAILWRHNLTKDGMEHALASAAENGHLEVVHRMIEHYPDVNVMYAMHGAAEEGCADIVRFLLERHPDFDVVRAVELAAENGYDELVRYLVANQPGVDVAMALDCAAKCGHDGIVLFLKDHLVSRQTVETGKTVETGQNCDDVANLNEYNGWQLLNGAAKNGHVVTVHHIIERQPDVDVSDALRMAAGSG
eukprot:869305_1